jgi:hypothetical protein
MSNKTHKCSLCDKLYSSQCSLSNHVRIIHNIRKDNTIKQHNCRYCNNEFSYQQSKWKHEQTCSHKNKNTNSTATPIPIPIPTDIETVEQIKEQNSKYKDEIIKLQKKLLKSNRLDIKTFKSLNKILIERSIINSNNNINNSITNNYQIVSLGNEDMVNVLTMQQKQQILNSKLNSIEKLVEITHCGEMNQYKNIIITNLKDNYAYRYDETKGYFIVVPKNTLLDNLVMLRLTDIEAIYDELKTANKIDDRTKKIIQNFLDKMENTETPVIENETKYENYKSFKIDNIKILLYNNQDKITKNIALLISDNKDELENTLS